MTLEDQEHWDKRYASGEYGTRTHATEILVDWIGRQSHRTGHGNRALDVACGAGRNALYLAEAHYQVDAIDVSSAALERARATADERGLSVNWVCSDLDAGDLPGRDYALIVVARFLDRRLLPRLVDALGEGGALVYETHLTTSADVGGPRSGRFRVRPQELMHLAHELRLVHYFEGITADRDGRRMALAQLIGIKGDAGF